jgi:hypothetical protein
MNKKKIDVGKVANELREGSVFFRSPTSEDPEAQPADAPTPRRRAVTTVRPADAAASRRRDSDASGRQGAPLDGAGDRVRTLAQGVQELGTKRTTIRFSRSEKAALREIVHTYDRREIRTTENELTRIAVSWLVEDYRELGEGSVLVRVVAQLQADRGEE